MKFTEQEKLEIAIALRDHADELSVLFRGETSRTQLLKELSQRFAQVTFPGVSK